MPKGAVASIPGSIGAHGPTWHDPPVFRFSAHYPTLGEILLPGASGGRTPGNPRKTNTRVHANCRATSGPLASQQGEREARAARPHSSRRGRRPPHCSRQAARWEQPRGQEKQQPRRPRLPRQQQQTPRQKQRHTRRGHREGEWPSEHLAHRETRAPPPWCCSSTSAPTTSSPWRRRQGRAAPWAAPAAGWTTSM